MTRGGDPAERDAAADGGRLLANIVRFARILRAGGLAATPEQSADLARALELVGVADRATVRRAARAVFVGRRREIPAFDRLFELFWRRPGDAGDHLPGPSLQPATRHRRRAVLAGATDAAADRGAGDDDALEIEPRAWSDAEVLRHKDFADLDPAEERLVRALINELELRLAPRRTRRRAPHRKGARLDLRRAMRRALRHGGEPLELPRRRRVTRARPLVVLCDVSASMEVYSRLLLQFVYAMGRASDRFEAFVFGTRLTRISRELAQRDIGRALAEATAKVVDWGGGTRIGDSLRAFNYDWGRRVLGRGAVVAVISDGWDCGDLDLLERETARLSRSSARLIWLNPLLGSPGYEPLTRGIRAILPHVDDFLPVHNLHSLEQLARVLGGIGRRPRAEARPGRHMTGDAA